MQRNNDIAGFESDFYGNKFSWFLAYVDEVYEAEEKRQADNLQRVAVRIIGLHDETSPIEELPLATVLLPNTQSSVHGIGATVGLEVGSFVFGFWLDRHRQHPCIVGTIPGITPESDKSSGDVANAVKFTQTTTTGDDATAEIIEVATPVAGGPTIW